MKYINAVVCFVFWVTGLEWLTSKIHDHVSAYKRQLNIVPVSFKIFMWSLGVITGATSMYVLEHHTTLFAQEDWSFEQVVKIQPVEAKEEIVEVVDCETAIEALAPKYEAPKTLMRRIMKAESGNEPTVENKVSTATGCFQWVIGSWRMYGKELWGEDFFSKNIYSPKDNVELAAYVIAKYGTSDWNASKHIWSK